MAHEFLWIVERRGQKVVAVDTSSKVKALHYAHATYGKQQVRVYKSTGAPPRLGVVKV